MIRSQASDIDVIKSVVVKVGNRAAQSIHLDRKPCVSGDVGEGAIFVVVIERRDGSYALPARPAHRVDQQNVLPAIVVIVDEGTTRTQGFREILFARRTAVMFELNSGLCCHIGESNWSRVSGSVCGGRSLSLRISVSGRFILL